VTFDPESEIRENLFERASADAEAGIARGHSDLGICYRYGLGVAEDNQEALRHYKIAHRLGDPYALANVAEFYRDGHGVPQDYTKALELHMRAAEGPDAGAAFVAALEVSDYYFKGLGIEPDWNEGKRWRVRAEGFHGNAAWEISDVRKMLSKFPVPKKRSMPKRDKGPSGPDIFITDKNGYRYYESGVRTQLRFYYIAFVIEAALAGTAYAFGSQPLFGLAAVLAVLTAAMCIPMLFINGDIRRERRYRAMDMAQAEAFRPDDAHVMLQQPHGNASDEGII